MYCSIIAPGLGDHCSATHKTAHQIRHECVLVPACTLSEETEARLKEKKTD